jgi:hypothetical protein
VQSASGLRPSPAPSTARSGPGKYRCARWAEQTTPSVPDPTLHTVLVAGWLNRCGRVSH